MVKDTERTKVPGHTPLEPNEHEQLILRGLEVHAFGAVFLAVDHLVEKALGSKHDPRYHPVRLDAYGVLERNWARRTSPVSFVHELREFFSRFEQPSTAVA